LEQKSFATFEFVKNDMFFFTSRQLLSVKKIAGYVHLHTTQDKIVPALACREMAVLWV
jgi:hypothetical protein